MESCQCRRSTSHQRKESLHFLLFGLFLFNSLTLAYAALLYSRIDSRFRSDGPLLFITSCQRIQHNQLTFVESIKNKLHLSTLAEHSNDVSNYLNFLQNNNVFSVVAVSDKYLLKFSIALFVLIIIDIFRRKISNCNIN
jgi:hypothetical protein